MLKKLTWLKKVKKIGISEVIKRAEIINNSLKPQVQNEILLLKVQNNTESVNPRVSNTSNGKTILLSKCAICGSKKSRSIKNQEAEGPLTNLGIK